MIIATISGRLGKDAAMRDTRGGPVCSFSIASDAKVKGEKITTWVGCAIFGKRGESLCQHLTKGTAVTVVGSISMRTHEGKSYLDCNVSELDLMGGGQRAERPAATQPAQGAVSTFDDGQYAGAATDDGDQFPF